MRLSLISVISVILICLAPSRAQTQDSASVRTVGLSAAIQGSQLDILVPIVKNHFSLAWAFGFMWMQDGETDIRLGIVPRFFFSRDKVAPYIGGRIGLMWRNSNTGWSEPDWLIGGAFGGEYFVDQHFSLGIESQVNLTISNTNSSRFGNPGKKNINTATAFFATVYF